MTHRGMTSDLDNHNSQLDKAENHEFVCDGLMFQH